jgi:hypothetical protein
VGAGAEEEVGGYLCAREGESLAVDYWGGFGVKLFVRTEDGEHVSSFVRWGVGAAL